jgi:hypothetical protein
LDHDNYYYFGFQHYNLMERVPDLFNNLGEQQRARFLVGERVLVVAQGTAQNLT